MTVILNPAANGGKGRKNYEQYCAPLLHLAGLKVSVIRTEAQSTDKPFFNFFLNPVVISFFNFSSSWSCIFTDSTALNDLKK